MKASENAVIDEFEQNSIRDGYAAAIREVAQPLADERDEYRELLQRIANARPDNPNNTHGDGGTLQRAIDKAIAILSKYQKP